MTPRKTLAEYLSQYAAEHTQLGTKLTHMVGIPMIVASLPVLPFNPLLGGGLFVGGWILQLIGHYYFEKNQPALVQDPLFMLVGPVWVAIEFLELFGIHLPIDGFADHSDRSAAEA